MINTSPPEILLAAYAELHYRFRFFKFSRYFRCEPEIIVDIPRLIENGKLPVLLIIKDADRYPIKFSSQLTLVFRSAGAKFERTIELDTSPIDHSLWWKLFELTNIPSGEYTCFAHLSYSTDGKSRKMVNHNHPHLQQSPMFLISSTEPLPKPEGFKIGDLHVHSDATSDQIEFGAPLNPTSRMAKAMGFDFAGITDHSYDIDDEPGNYLKNDPDLKKWKRLLRETEEINASLDNDHAELILGQEITVRNSRDKNVHLLLFGGKKFFPGSGDSAEKWFRTRSEHSIEEILASRPLNSFAAAAHPFEPVPILQKLFFGRDVWRNDDFHDSLKHAQIANGDYHSNVKVSIHRWQKLLSEGKHTALLAGTDSHGNFNRYRQVYLPMLSLVEHELHTFGRHFTGVLCPKDSDTLSNLNSGCTYISDGPGIALTVDEARPGMTVEPGKRKIHLNVISSAECGGIKNVELIFINRAGEWISKEIDQPASCNFSADTSIDLSEGFIFASALTDKGRFCFTSAVRVL